MSTLLNAFDAVAMPSLWRVRTCMHIALQLASALHCTAARRWSRFGTGRRTCSGAPSSTPGPSTCGMHALRLSSFQD